MATNNDRDMTTVSYQPSKKHKVDFTDWRLYSMSASTEVGNFDVKRDLNEEYAFVVPETAGVLKVELYYDADGDADFLYFQAGNNPYKVRKIWYADDNAFDTFMLVWNPRP